MAEATALSLSQFFSELSGKHVSFAMRPGAESLSGDQVYGLYHVAEDRSPFLLCISTKTLALLAGALLGLPADLVMERVKQVPEDEPLRDAMHEVLNIASTALSPSTRIVFKSMSRTSGTLPADAKGLLTRSRNKSSFHVSVEGSPKQLLTYAH